MTGDYVNVDPCVLKKYSDFYRFLKSVYNLGIFEFFGEIITYKGEKYNNDQVVKPAGLTSRPFNSIINIYNTI